MTHTPGIGNFSTKTPKNWEFFNVLAILSNPKIGIFLVFLAILSNHKIHHIYLILAVSTVNL